jgi:putative transposase
MEQAFRYRVYPTPEQETLLRRTLGCVRLVYNRALNARTEAWYERQEKVDYNKRKEPHFHLKYFNALWWNSFI